MSGTLDELDTEFSATDDVEIPENPGPAILDREPVVGSVRRSQGMTVIRDEVSEKLDEI
jgi:hypothetical protein